MPGRLRALGGSAWHPRAAVTALPSLLAILVVSARLAGPGGAPAAGNGLLQVLGIAGFVLMVVAFQMVAAQIVSRDAAVVLAGAMALSPGAGSDAVAGRPEQAIAGLALLMAWTLARGTSTPGLAIAAAIGGGLALIAWPTLAVTVPILVTAALLARRSRPQALATGLILALLLAGLRPAVSLARGHVSLQDLGLRYVDVLSIPLTAVHHGLFGSMQTLSPDVPTLPLLTSPDLLLTGLLVYAAAVGAVRVLSLPLWPLGYLPAYILVLLAGAPWNPVMALAGVWPVVAIGALAGLRLAAPTAAAAAVATRARRRLWEVAGLGGLVVGAVLVAVAWDRRLAQLHHSLATSCQDTCFFAQSLWAAAHGDGLRTTSWLDYQSLLAQHAYLVQWLLVPLYGLWPHANAVLFAVQPAALTAAAIAAFLVARALGATVLEGVLIGLAMLAHPSSAGTSTGLAFGIHYYGYHPDSLFPLSFLLAYLAYLRRAWIAFVPLLALSFSVHEAYSLVWLGAAAVWFLRGDRRVAVTVGAAAVAWLLFATQVLIPAAAGGAHPFYYKFLALQPGWMGTMAVAALHYTIEQVISWGGLPLLSPVLLAALPTLAIDSASTAAGYALTTNIGSWHAMAFLPLLAIAAAEGLVYLRTRLPRFRVEGLAALALMIVAMAAVSTHIYPPEPAPNVSRIADADWLESALPAQAPVAASTSLAGHFAERRDLVLFRDYHDAANSTYLVVDTDPRLPEEGSPGAQPGDLMSGSAFALVAHCDGILVYHRTSDGPLPPDFERTRPERCRVS